jgi:hypothetical protein
MARAVNTIGQSKRRGGDRSSEAAAELKEFDGLGIGQLPAQIEPKRAERKTKNILAALVEGALHLALGAPGVVGDPLELAPSKKATEVSRIT